MPGNTLDQPELALRYLLAKSGDVRAAYLVDDGSLIATAPGVSEGAEADVERLAQLLGDLRGGHEEPIELDALCERDLLLMAGRSSITLICVADRTALPGIVLHEMRATLDDLTTVGRTPVAPEEPK